MADQRQCYAGVDWVSESQHVFVTDVDGRDIAERAFKHGGEGLAAMAAWLIATSGASEPSQILVAIEVPHGPVVETLIERGFKVHAINPKQMDRFRDRFTLAGAKDDSRDAQVMASALRTDPRCFRLLAVADPVVIELREWSRIAEDLATERNRLTNRMREQLWRYFPAMLELEDDLGAQWLLDLWQAGARTGQVRTDPRNKRHQAAQAPSHPPLRCRPCARCAAQAPRASCRRHHRSCQRTYHHAHRPHPPGESPDQAGTAAP
jgi:transposase